MNTDTFPVEAIRPRDRDALLQSLRSGTVPRVGQHLIQVGRSREIEALFSDIERIVDGGSAFRLVIGEYGSGKTFFLNQVRSIALKKRLVVVNADLNPDRRLHAASGGQARSLYAELMRNVATRTKSEGALASIVESFVNTAKIDSDAAGQPVEQVIRQKLAKLTEMVNGFAFAEVIAAYWRGGDQGNEQLMADAVRWLRGEFATKIEARHALGVRTIVDDAGFYDQLKLFAAFARLSGYSGLLVNLDEMVNLYKMPNAPARNANYEQLLRILNDCMQGTAIGLGFVLGGTPEFLLDPRRGLYSYSALQSRLAANTFASSGLVDHSGPVVRLARLEREEFYVLLQKILHVHASGDPAKYLVPEEAIIAFMEHCRAKLGADLYASPRNTIKSFIDLLAILEQNPGSDWRDLVRAVDVRPEAAASPPGEELGEDLASFRV